MEHFGSAQPKCSALSDANDPTRTVDASLKVGPFDALFLLTDLRNREIGHIGWPTHHGILLIFRKGPYPALNEHV